MTTTLTRRRARERDRHQPTLFSQVVAPPPLRDEPRREEPRRDEPWRDEPRRDEALREPAESWREEPAHVDAPPAHDEAPTASARTLDEALSALWGELSTGTAIDCPVCGGAMEPRHSAGAGVVGGRCGSCATTLA
jgi:hypothetical protein